MPDASKDAPQSVDDDDLDQAAAGRTDQRDHDYVGNFNFKVEINGVQDVTVNSWDTTKKPAITGKGD